ncbi:hypothetical protein E2C01_055596 [Portunus trituberculatus]|uniref:Uncharacterized protein n=1 Tax=Portunus trituberculatus TaxID=210409 RepID=A0A5B7GY44_PORTR|nr:hypothetical protein [Portunus trituberculatus]
MRVGRREGSRGRRRGRGTVVAVQHLHEVGDVGGGEAQRLDLGQLGVGGHVGDALPQLREGVVDALRAPPLLLVGRRPPLHHSAAPVHHLDGVVAAQIMRGAGAHHEARGHPVLWAGHRHLGREARGVARG